MSYQVSRSLRYRLVMFDFDGTLADTFPLFGELLGEIIQRYGLRPVQAEDIESLRRMRTAEILKRIGVPRWKLPLIMRDARARMAVRREEISLFDGVRPLLTRLSEQGVALAVVSSNREDTVRAVLGDALAARVQQFACGAGLFGKPAKIRRVLRATNVSAQYAALVGDESRDIDAARRMRVAAVAVTWGYAAREMLATADVLCQSIDELSLALMPPFVSA